MLKKIASYVLVLGIGAIIGTYFDAKHTIEEKVVFKDRTRTIVKEVITERPDGTKVTERVTDRKEKVDTKQARKESKPVKKNWGIGVTYGLGTVTPVYGVQIHRRVFSDIYVTAYGKSNHSAGVGLTLFF